MEKWEVEKDDFWSGHDQFLISRPYRLWFEYLKVSPTIALAHKMRATKLGLTPEEIESLPEDFEQVLKVYDDFLLRYVFRDSLSFHKWWSLVAEKAFGIRLAKPTVKLITEFRPKNDYAHEATIERFSHFIEKELETQLKRGFGHLILSIPMTGNKSQLLKQISEIIQSNDHPLPKAQLYATYPLDGQRTNLEAIKDGLRLLWTRAEEPDLKRWQLGTKANISDTYSILDPTQKKALTAEERKMRKAAGDNASRAFRTALKIMENAARGRFPSHENVEIPYIDWIALNKRLKKQKKQFRYWVVLPPKNGPEEQID